MFEIAIGEKRFAVEASLIRSVIPCSVIVRPAAAETGLAMLPSGQVATLISLATSPIAALDVRTGDQHRTLIEVDCILRVDDFSGEQPLTLELIDDLKRKSSSGWARSGN